MTKYVRHKHGLIIGSDNEFSLLEDGKIRGGYRAIVWAKPMVYQQINTINSGLETPVNQILWKRVRSVGDIFGWVLNPFIRAWLTREVGEQRKDWDVYSLSESSSSRTIYFKRRGDGIKLVKFLENQLKGAHQL